MVIVWLIATKCSSTHFSKTHTTDTNTLKLNRNFVKLNLFADAKTLPQNELKEGSEVIDGLTFVFQKFGAAEAAVQLVVKLPELKTVIAADLVFFSANIFWREP